MPPDTVQWSVTIEQANQILAVLGREPHDEVVQLIMSLRMQWARQQQERQKPAKVEKEPNGE